MPKIKVTQKKIEALVRTPHGRQTDYTDQLTAGLCFRMGPRGGVWYFLRRVDGRLYRVKLGSWPTMGIKQARDAVAEHEQAIAEGRHPKAEAARKRAEKSHARNVDESRLLENVAEAWMKRHLPGLKPQTRSMYQRAVQRLIAAFPGRSIETVTRGELVRVLDSVKAESDSGVPANHLAATIRLMWRYAHDRLELEQNPAIDLKNPAITKSRQRVLDRAEIRIVWTACEWAGYPFGHAIRFQLCTGQRIGEVGDIRRNEVTDGYWRLSRNKTAKRIDVYLAGLAQAILDDCADYGDDTPYFSASGGEIGLRPDGFHNALNRHIRPRLDDAAAELDLPPITEHWTPHDLRRTVRSGLTGWAGVFPDIAERTINHSIGGIRAVYDHADYRPHVSQALQAWDDELARILLGEQVTVRPIRRSVI